MKKIEQKFIKYCDENELIVKGDKILVALSGGPDSVFLLSILFKYKNRFDIEIGAFHLNHNIRGRSADLDEEFCKSLCEVKEIKFFKKSRNVKIFAEENHYSLEEAGRKIRYEELNRTAKKNNYNKIATAHNSDDNAETVFLNLIKGAGLQGISGIPPKRENIIRPILSVSNEEIINSKIDSKIALIYDFESMASFRIQRQSFLMDYK